MMQIYVSYLAIIGSDNGLLPICNETIVWTNDGLILTGP